MFRASIRAAAIVCVGLAAAVLSAGAAEEAETLDEVELIPKDRAGWTATNFFAPVTGLFMGGPGYWYSPRRIEIRTTPPDASLDLFYVRRNFQKGYEQADAPARVTLPPRIEAGSRDSLNIRAFADGYKQKEVSVRIRSRDESVMIDLEPLSNSLVALTHLYFAGRSSLELLTKEALTFRVQPFGEGYRFILLQTGNSEAATASMRGIEDALVGSLRPQQLGEDLVLSVELTEQARDEEVEVRQFQSSDAIRRLHSLRIDILPKAGAGSPVQRGREALLRVRAADVTGCALRFDARMREGLDSAALARALTPTGGHFTEPYLRAAMKRQGELSPGGSVKLADGTAFDTRVPIELAAAVSQAGEVRGYLAMLRAFVRELEAPAGRHATLRGLIAPELSPEAFDALLASAEQAERACRASDA